MARLNDFVFGSFNFTVKGYKVSFIGEEITIAHRVDGRILISRFCAMDTHGCHWLLSFVYDNGEYYYSDNAIHSYEYVQACIKRSVQIQATIDGIISFEVNVARCGIDYISKIEELV